MFTMRGLRIAAWAVATATFLFLSLGVVGVGDVMGWIPLWWARALVSAVFLAPAVVGRPVDRQQRAGAVGNPLEDRVRRQAHRP